jgi:hypothetical protein
MQEGINRIIHEIEKRMKRIIELPYGKKLDNCVSCIYRMREWLGEGIDVLIWWKDRKGICHYFQSLMGETDDKQAVPKIVAHENIDSKAFDKFLQSLEYNGILEFQMDEDPKILNNYNDYYFIYMEDGRSNDFRLVHGYHGDPRFKKIKNAIHKNTM